MKFLQAASFAFISSQLAVAAPSANDVRGLVEYMYDSVNPQHEVIAALNPRKLEKRFSCETLSHVIRSIGTSQTVVVYITLAGTFTSSACRYVHGNDCSNLVLMIQNGIVLIYTAAAHYSSAQPEMIPGARKRGDDDVHAGYVDGVNVLSDSSNDLVYETISNLPFDDKEEMLQRRDGDPALVSRVLISGMTGSHSPNMKQDIVVNHFADGNTLLHLPVDNSVPSGSGFKISYTTRAKTKLSYSQQQEMSGFTAASWAATSKLYDMTDFIGFAKAGYNANFYFRIIPEVRGFGLNYESVDICGQMGDFLFD